MLALEGGKSQEQAFPYLSKGRVEPTWTKESVYGESRDSPAHLTSAGIAEPHPDIIYDLNDLFQL